MRKWIVMLLMSMGMIGNSAYASITANDVYLDLGFSWQVRSSYPGLFSTSIGYTYINNLFGDVGIYISNRNISNLDLETFFEELHPLEDRLLPYATTSWTPGTSYEIFSIEDTSIGKLPAKKVVIRVIPESSQREVIIAYLVSKGRKGLFYDSQVGYTISFSCYEEKFEMAEQEIRNIVSRMRIL